MPFLLGMLCNFFLHLMFRRARLLFHDCPLVKKKDFLSRAANYNIVLVVISSRTLLAANQPN